MELPEVRTIAKKKNASSSMVAAVIGVSVGLVIAFAVLPIALEDAAAATTANWGAAGVAILALFGLVAAVGLIYYMLKAFDIL